MICAIILAAGKSLRTGTQKLLLPFANQTIIGHVADQVIKSSIRQVLVVTAEQSEAIAAALKGKRLSIVINPDFEGDMLNSIRCGLRALPGCDAVMILLGDQQGIRSELVGEMVKIFETTNVSIIVPTYRGRRGHPILFAGKYCDEVQKRFDGVGLRGLLSAHPEQVHEMKVDDPAVLADVDNPQEYQRETARQQRE
ncbi:MAG TPA: nucleotidyltransferase family protein [Tepidisphaeraceae bacterium]|jgi:molybdenum cofactor cytidylyltransferase|nr:nucleotidyltransferase family protein [Tepidisphaeraceae bacterium]